MNTSPNSNDKEYDVIIINGNANQLLNNVLSAIISSTSELEGDKIVKILHDLAITVKKYHLTHQLPPDIGCNHSINSFIVNKYTKDLKKLMSRSIQVEKFTRGYNRLKSSTNKYFKKVLKLFIELENEDISSSLYNMLDILNIDPDVLFYKGSKALLIDPYADNRIVLMEKK